MPERISTAFRRCGGAVTVLEMGPSWLWDSPTAPPAQRSLGDAKKNGRVFRHHNWSQTRPNCCGDAPTCRAGRRRGRVYVSCRMKNPLECHLPTRMPKMILVFYASLAPRGYGRTSPRPSRVFLPFVQGGFQHKKMRKRNYFAATSLHTVAGPGPPLARDE